VKFKPNFKIQSKDSQMTNYDNQTTSGESIPRIQTSRKGKAIKESIRLLGFEETDAIIKHWRKSKPSDEPGAMSEFNDFLLVAPGIIADLEFTVVTDNFGIWSLSAVQVKVVLNSIRSTEGFSILEQEFQVKTAPLPTREQIIRQVTEWAEAETRKERAHLLSSLRPEFEWLGFPDCSLFIWQPATGWAVGSLRFMLRVGDKGEKILYSFTPAMDKNLDMVVISSVTIAFFRTWPDGNDYWSNIRKSYRRADGPIPSRDMMIWQLLSKTIKSFTPSRFIKRSYAAGFKESRMAIANTRQLLARCQNNPNQPRQYTTVS
jgi:hypothetical protein